MFRDYDDDYDRYEWLIDWADDDPEDFADYICETRTFADDDNDNN